MPGILDLQAMSVFAERTSDILSGGATICLNGALGTGKTTFVRFFCQAAGAGGQVSSPSFVMENEYRTAAGLHIEHWDLYRTHEPPQELLEPPGRDTLRVIEWAEHAPDVMSQADLVVRFDFHDNPLSEIRRIEISGPLAEQLRGRLSL